jgi:exopolyphosphatase / guanosine-5'-triphosphate,3'-diphosphate pyrophosphatase
VRAPSSRSHERTLRPAHYASSMALEPKQRVAVIDLGSNSFRMVVFADAGASWERQDELSSAVRIGEGLAASGRLSEDAMERALVTLDGFTELCERHGLHGHTVDAVATSAIRDAENGGEFLERVRLRTGLDVRVLSREQEARYGYLAAVNSTTLTEGCVLDLGGGSMQLVRVAGRLARESGSWRLGAVRMSERFLASEGPAKRSQLKALGGHVSRKLERAPWLRQTGPRLVGLGGTVRNLAAAAERAAGLPAEEVQGFLIERVALDELVERLAALPASERASVPGIKATRADIVLAGAVVIQTVMRDGGFDAIEVTGAGLREGILFERQLIGRQPEPNAVALACRANRVAPNGVASNARAA